LVLLEFHSRSLAATASMRPDIDRTRRIVPRTAEHARWCAVDAVTTDRGVGMSNSRSAATFGGPVKSPRVDFCDQS